MKFLNFCSSHHHTPSCLRCIRLCLSSLEALQQTLTFLPAISSSYLYPPMFLKSLLLLVLATFSAALSPRTSTLHRHSKRASITQISSFLNAHNSARGSHGAAPLNWSSSLASKAEEWATSCQFRHSEGTLREAPYGENIVAASGQFSVQAAVQTFLDTKSQYSPEQPVYNQWTQVAWKDTQELGCAVSTCNNIFDRSYGPATMVVCLYSPPGNVVGQIQDNVEV
ncbi:hypothetical protein E1B28_004657 [Marasmius oreades]|uniref:SCP domain-containing protein n=1 Tax=Marasmius oreades TaxID=181124 RepID=A0A9P7UZ71_9AGAR|nr:uncharacterized protein E1B28_004657 [Marasmius oreades]KAG7097293.1 hypothetical protein E1B28_004657 [Marasmius oreades]